VSMPAAAALDHAVAESMVVRARELATRNYRDLAPCDGVVGELGFGFRLVARSGEPEEEEGDAMRAT
jgi:hypothetical protein